MIWSGPGTEAGQQRQTNRGRAVKRSAGRRVGRPDWREHNSRSCTAQRAMGVLKTPTKRMILSRRQQSRMPCLCGPLSNASLMQFMLPPNLSHTTHALPNPLPCNPFTLLSLFYALVIFFICVSESIPPNNARW